MVRKGKAPAKKRYPDAFRLVFLDLSAKDLDPDKITETLCIQPDSSCRRGFMKDRDGRVIKDKNGKPRRWSVGAWIVDAHVHENSGLEIRIKDILEQIKPKKAALRRILEKVNATLTVVVEPHKDLCVAAYFLPANLLNEFTSLGIDIEFRVDIPQKWAEFRQEIERKTKRRKKDKPHVKRGAK